MWFRLVVVDENNEIVIVNIISYMCFWLARERGCETKTIKLMAARSGPTWGSVQASES